MSLGGYVGTCQAGGQAQTEWGCPPNVGDLLCPSGFLMSESCVWDINEGGVMRGAAGPEPRGLVCRAEVFELRGGCLERGRGEQPFSLWCVEGWKLGCFTGKQGAQGCFSIWLIDLVPRAWQFLRVLGNDLDLEK